MRNLIVFGDYGLDDAAATATVLSNADHFEKITIVPIGGNVPVEVSFRNCITLLNHLPVANHKITVVDAREVPQSAEYLATIHGGDGMGDVLVHDASMESISVLQFDEWIEHADGTETVLSLGPMTLVKTFLSKYPNCPLVFMAGCVKEAPNFKGYEFNQALDVEAFAFCTKHPHVAITLDTCRIPKLNLRNYEIPGDSVYARLLRADQALSVTRGEDGCYVWDDVAACYLFHPERFEVVRETDRWGNQLYHAKYVSALPYFES